MLLLSKGLILESNKLKGGLQIVSKPETGLKNHPEKRYLFLFCARECSIMRSEKAIFFINM